MSNVWFISDLHKGHRKVAETRGFANVQDHDDTIAGLWERNVKWGDHVFILGDLSAGGSAAQREALDWLRQLPGHKHLIGGNHDGIHAMYRDAHRWEADYRQVFASTSVAARRKIGQHRVLLSHFPYDGDHTAEDRHEQWRLRDMGVPILHGHTHSDKIVSRSKTGTLQIHVGVDAWGLTPVSLDEIAVVLDAEL